MSSSTTLTPISDDDIAQTIAYALKKNRKAIQKLSSTDDEANMRAALLIVAQLRLAGVESPRRCQELPSESVLRGPKGQ